ncbi:MAG: formylmethanofuran dehydrogenase subunit C [Gammaproteobacteria bacterium]|nr:formylmethanofuran dehydrogenase subunit C [Gammaproteobacteria bacterium]
MITLRLRLPVPSPVDVSGLQPALVGGLELAVLGRMKLRMDGKTRTIDELFALSGKPEADRLRITGVTPALEGLGTEMREGLLLLEGDCGDAVGAGMRGGEIRLTGNARHRVGAGMRAGLIRISGSVGDFAGGPLPGAVSGMRGGSLLIDGNAGARLADRLRRGLILVAGDTGPAPASQMIAGTVIILGTPGDSPGSGMRRGSLLIKAGDCTVPPTFVATGTHELSFITLLMRHLETLDPRHARALRGFRRVRRLVGDRGCGGQGEILFPGR